MLLKDEDEDEVMYPEMDPPMSVRLTLGAVSKELTFRD